jgi:hypothetical protein
VLLAVEVHDNPSDMNALVPMVRRSAERCATAGLPCLIKAWLADNGYASTANFAALADRPLLVAISSGTPAGPSGPRAERPVPQGRTLMAEQLATPEGTRLYSQRSRLVEPGFAQLFQRFSRRLHRRGAPAVATEVTLLGTVHNLAKLFVWRARAGRLTVV